MSEYIGTVCPNFVISSVNFLDFLGEKSYDGGFAVHYAAESGSCVNKLSLKDIVLFI
jgi:hypothetical protein